MTKSALSSVLFLLCCPNAAAFSLSMGSESRAAASDIFGSRRSFLSKSVATAVVGGTSIFSQPQPSLAVTAKEIITTPAGVKYAVTQEPTDKKPAAPLKGDIVAIDYTGYLSNGQIFDATHSGGKNNALLFKLGSGSVIPGLDDVVAQMVVGQKVQAIIPPSLAYGEKGVCLDDGECLIKPGSTLVYDVFLKRSSIPPP
mmetsp:Transcript_36215/g.87409  ORF Transcript_36215/g.87409 Transcript_36215/m.87409 type:complete len:199 (-) Transcript_36215:280-876(-)